MLRRGPFVLKVGAFVVLCFWASSGWIWAQILPAQMGTIPAQGFHLVLIGLVLVVWNLIRRESLPRPRILGRIVLGGLALFAAPVLLLHTAQGMVASSLTVVIYSILPVAVMVMTGGMKGLVPALLGVAGVLMLLPVSLPQGRGLLGAALMVAAMLLTACALIRLPRSMSGIRWSWSAATICLTSGAVLSIAGWERAALGYEALRAFAIDAPEVLLLLWLIAGMEPRRLASRWLVAPLLTVVEGYVLMRPQADARLLLGVSLLSLGSAWVFAGRDEDDADRGGLGLQGV